ncbi:hypothetical protein [Paracoccus shanxieyensis]|uniref:Uncharacterized protein n=1 Tax=Paracoccus shanxieyensis TaxID=2675752 RepID=A0A6L6IV09_9RHOB|nr:hypothetical protein [Paracoccus shanxieyensis]MTH64033.1 hypothetical protein [Paracoccus shanxieyensis]MTH86926.1 hypothetical protein [Paracoccus shanxieyensis]
MVPLLAGCVVVDAQDGILTRQQIEERTPYASVSTGQAWVNAPGMRSVLQRNLRTGLEQKISLANDSAVRGDNVMMLRTQNGVSGFGRLRFESVIDRFGGMPYPFTDVSSGSLLQGDDGVGAYFWVTENLGDATCILGMRRLNSGMRQLPGNGGVMDIVLRNCVRGTQQDALAPLMADSIGVAPIARDPQGNSRMLSPLAAPSASVIPVQRAGTQP